MLRFLSSYLIVTGIAAAIALAMPGLVVLGFFLLILPGLLLSLAPTAFLWGCVFTASWLVARTVVGQNLITFLVAVALTGGALAAVTMPNRAASLAAYRASLIPDVTPPRKIQMRGDIRIDVPRPNWDNVNSKGKVGLRGFSCDNLCVALLFTPGVTSVTINNSYKLTEQDHRQGSGGFDVEARTYRLMPKAQCAGRGLLPDLSGRNGLFHGKLEEGTALSAEWNLRLASEVCLVRSGPLGRHDLLIREGSYGADRGRSPWSLMPSKPSIEYIEFRNSSGKVLLRRFKSKVEPLSRLLFIWGDGGIENFKFGWGRSTVSNKPDYGAINLLGELERHTNTVGRLSGADLLPRLRQQLQSALDDPSVPDDAPQFRLLAAYFDAVSKPLSAEDLDIVTRLGRDDRIRRYEGIWKLEALPREQQDAIRAAIVDRSLATADSAKLSRSAAGIFLEKLPDGSFASLTATEERLLTSPDRRWSLPVLTARLHESGAGRVPLLLSIIREHGSGLAKNFADANARRIKSYEKNDENGGHRQMVEAARKSLCMLGSKASAAVAPLRQMLGDGTMPSNLTTGHEGADWDFTLARMGFPVDQLRKPERMSGTDEQHRNRIRDKLKRNDPKRHC